MEEQGEVLKSEAAGRDSLGEAGQDSLGEAAGQDKAGGGADKDPQKKVGLIQFYKNFEQKHERFAEIVRFIIVGEIATLVDWLVMGLILYAFNPSLYPRFYNVWIGKMGEPATIATVIGTGVGFLVSLVVNYLLSVLFVYKEVGNSKTAKGRVLFFVLSAVGLGINMLGMWFGRDVCHINEWIVKIIMTIIVLVYNYVTRKIFIFRGQGEENK